MSEYVSITLHRTHLYCIFFFNYQNLIFNLYYPHDIKLDLYCISIFTVLSSTVGMHFFNIYQKKKFLSIIKFVLLNNSKLINLFHFQSLFKF